MCSRAKLDPTKLWHRRLTRISYKDLVHVVNSEKIRGISKLSGKPRPICGKCMKGKQTKRTHKKVKKKRTTKPLDLHMDLIGPIQIEGKGDKRYVLVVVNDFSRYSFVSFLIENLETKEHLKSLFDKIQVKIGHTIIKIRSDRGVEFDNMDVDPFYKSKWIKD